MRDPAHSLDFGPLLLPADPPIPAGFLTESGRRTRPAHELREFLTPYLDDYGITRVAHLTGFDHVGLPVHMAVKPQGTTLSSGSGKGPTPDASWVSAVMECSEQTVWEELDLESVHASRSMLLRTGAAAVDGALLPQLKGAIWHDDLPIAWVEGWDIVSGSTMWIPENLVTVPYAHKGELKPFVSGSNGLASGAHVLEAILSALQEVIERDGLALRTVCDPAPHAQAMALLESAAPDIAERIRRSGLQLEAIDATTEIGVPVVAAYLHEREGGTTGSFKGMGAGTSLATALVRAVTEAAQARCLVVAGARDDVFETARSAAVTRAASARPEPELELTASVDHATGSVLGDIEWMTGRLAAAGFPHVIVLRHSQPGDPVQVVRVVVPGLEGYPFASAQVGERGRTWTASTRLAQAAS